MSKTTIAAWRCDRCQWVWVSESKPDRCAKCKSRTWDIPVGHKVLPPAAVEAVHGHAACDPDYTMPLRASVPIPRASPTRYIHDVKTCKLYGCLMCKDAKA